MLTLKKLNEAREKSPKKTSETKKDPPNRGGVRKVPKKPDEVKNTPSQYMQLSKRPPRKVARPRGPASKPGKSMKVPPSTTALKRKSEVKDIPSSQDAETPQK